MAKEVERLITLSAGSWDRFLLELQESYPEMESDISLRQEAKAIPGLNQQPTPPQVRTMLHALEDVHSRMSTCGRNEQEWWLILFNKVPSRLWDRLTLHKENKVQMGTYEGLAQVLLNSAYEGVADLHLASYRDGETQFLNVVKGTGQHFSESVTGCSKCTYCGKLGHVLNTCWTKMREEKLTTSASKPNSRSSSPGGGSAKKAAKPAAKPAAGSMAKPVAPIPPIPPPPAGPPPPIEGQEQAGRNLTAAESVEERRKRQRVNLLEELVNVIQSKWYD